MVLSFYIDMALGTIFGNVISYKYIACTLNYFRTRYFSAPRKGHNPLQGRAYYQLLECLGVSLNHVVIMVYFLFILKMIIALCRSFGSILP